MMRNSTIGAMALALVLTLPATMPAQAQDVPDTAAPAVEDAPAAPAGEVTAVAPAPAQATAPATKKASFADKATAIVGGAAAGFAAFKLLQSALKKKEAPAQTPPQ